MAAVGKRAGGGRSFSRATIEALESRRLFTAANLAAEYQHIIDCQDLNANSATYGAINDVTGAATWVVPGEMAFAAMELKRGGYATNANLAAAFLAKVQGSDGAWADQYSLTSNNTVAISNAARDTRQTAQVVLALKTIGGSTYTRQATLGANWLKAHLVTAGTGNLVDGGLDANGNEQVNRWASDNAFAAAAFNAVGYATQKTQVVKAINSVLMTSDHWYAAVDGSNHPLAETGGFTWVDFAPAFMNLKKLGVIYPAGAAQEIIEQLQVIDGPNAGAVWETGLHDHFMPGIGFQAAIAIASIGEPVKATGVSSATVSNSSSFVHGGLKSEKDVVTAKTGTVGGSVQVDTITRNVDLSAATTISLWDYDNVGSNTVQVKLVDSSGAVSNAVWSSTAAKKKTWSQLSWTVAGFSGIDKSRIAAIQIYEYNNGAYYFDDVTFQSGGVTHNFQDFESFASRHDQWAINTSGLLQSAADAGGYKGGWIDWKDPVTNETAAQWQRFIDTSAYLVMAENGWTF